MLRKISEFLNAQLRLSRLAIFTFVPFSIAAAPFAFSFRIEAPSLSKLLSIGFFVTVPTVSFYLILLKISQTQKTENRTLLNFLILGATGIFRGLLFFYTLEYLKIDNPAPLLGRVLNSTFTVVFWVGLASIVIESQRRFKRRYGALLSQLLILRLRNNTSPNSGYALMAQQIARMQLKIKKSIQDRDPHLSDMVQARALADTLREEIETELRPLSQQLWIKSVYSPPTPKISHFFWNALSELQYPFTLTAILYACTNVVNTTQSLGFVAGLVYGISTFLIFSLLEKTRRFLVKRFLQFSPKINFCFITSIGLVVGLLSHGFFRLIAFDYSFAVAILSAPSLPILILSASGIQLTLQNRQTIVDLLNNKLALAKNLPTDSIVHGNVAAYLHNSLQSELLALAIQLDSLSENPDPERNRLVMEKIEALISQSRSEDFKNFLESPEERFRRIVDSWDGITKINFDVSESVWLDGSRSSIVVALAQEAIANAVRSGQATQIDISVSLEGDSLVVSVLDNGYATLLPSNRGIGSQWIDRIAVSDWKLEVTETGHALRVEI